MNKVFFLSLIFSMFCFGKTFRIAGLYPSTTAGHLNCTCGHEAACITKAAVEEARLSGLDVSIDMYQTDRTVLGAIDAANKVITNKYDAAVGALISIEAIPISEMLENAKIPFITPTATNPRITDRKRFVTRIPFNDYRQANLLAKLATQDLKGRRIAIVKNLSNPYSDFLGTQFAKEISVFDPKVSVTEFPIIDGFVDFNMLAAKIIASAPDIVFVPLSQELIASLYVELAAQNRELILLGSDTIEARPRFLELFGEGKTKIRFIFPKHWNGTLKGPMAEHYLRLQKRHCSKYDSSMASVAAFDAIELLLRAIQSAPSARGERLINAMRNVPFYGITGHLVYGKDGDPIKPLELFELKNNSFRYWKRY